MDRTNFHEIRKALNEREAAGARDLGPPNADLEEYYHPISMRDGHQSRIKICRPIEPPTLGSPLLILFHGGGFVFGTVEQMTAPARGLVNLFGAVVVSVTYRLAPEHKFPKAVEDAWDSFEWIISNAEGMLKAKASQGLVVGGGSAGGNLAAVITQMAMEKHVSPPITGQWLSIPHLFTEEIVPKEYKSMWFSREQNSNAMVLNAAALSTLDSFYAPDVYSEFFSPVNASTQVDLPPTYIQVCGLDPLRDDGLVYEQILRAHGVKTRLDSYAGVPHGSWSLFPTIKSSKKATMDVALGIGWLLKQEVDEVSAEKQMAGPGTM